MRPNPRLLALAWPVRTARRQTKFNDVTLAVSVTVSTTERSQVRRLAYGRELFGYGLLVNGDSSLLTALLLPERFFSSHRHGLLLALCNLLGNCKLYFTYFRSLLHLNRNK